MVWLYAAFSVLEEVNLVRKDKANSGFIMHVTTTLCEVYLKKMFINPLTNAVYHVAIEIKVGKCNVLYKLPRR